MNSTLEDLHHILADADCVADADTVRTAIERLAREIGSVLGEQRPILYTVMNGGLVFAGQLIARLDFPLELGYLHASRYRGRTSGAELHWQAVPTPDPRGRAVLVIDDILDEGHTLQAIVSALQEAGARSVHTAVLVHKLHARKALPGMRADFSGLDLPDRYLFGCGMDYRGWWRNTAAIYAVKGL